MHRDKIPFGMLFEEPANMAQLEVIQPEYDPVDSISYSINADGHRVSYISNTWNSFGTQTATSVRAEEPDTDPTSTDTATKIRAETTE